MKTRNAAMHKCLCAIAALLLAGCQSNNDLKQQRIEKADKHFDAISKRVIPPATTLTLPMCIEAALKNNLDLRVEEMQEAIAKERLTAEMLGMLPELNFNETLTNRSNEPGSSSQSLKTGEQSLVSSKSSEKGESSFRMELALSSLDFGLAYFNSMQANDRVHQQQQQLRRSAQSLIVDVVSTYFRVAAAQFAVERTEDLLSKCDQIDNTLIELTKDKVISPLRALDERKKFITQRKRLMEFRRSYENSCLELRSLMGYMPVDNLKVDVRCLEKLNEINLPDPDILTRIAIKERPELYQLDIQHHMTILEARKVILMMFPNVRIFEDFNSSTNKFLYNQSWWEMGVRAAYNLLKLPQQIEQYRALNKDIDSVEVKTLALTIGVMAQVRISHANMMEAKDRYELDQKVYNAYSAYLDYARSNASAIGKISPLEITRMELETVETSIDRTMSLSNYYLSYYKLLNSIGIESIDQVKIDDALATLVAQAKKEAEAEKAAGAPEALTEAEAKAMRDLMALCAPPVPAATP